MATSKTKPGTAAAPKAAPPPVLTPRQRIHHARTAQALKAKAHELLSQADAHAKLAKRGRA